MVTIVCMKWGEQFNAGHVNILFAGVSRHMTEPFKFVCFTNESFGIHSEIVIRPLPEIGLNRRGWTRCWPKLNVFDPSLFDPLEVVLFLDLDIIVQASLTPLIELVRVRRHLIIQREWNPDVWSLLPLWLRPDRGAQSSVFGFRPADVGDIYSTFVAEKDTAVACFRNDQSYLTHAVKDRSYWPSDFCVSFKRTCIWYYPLNLVFRKIKRPKKAKIVVFHGSPRPWETVVPEGKRWGPKWRFGIGPVDWIRQYLDQAVVEGPTDQISREASRASNEI
ncbi:hypothetical protein [Agrobacterium rosae]|uniref:hypothetical protein n=1 Tax=Agrobacterium rosae TaxID=1972867 RepID=UPI003A7F96FB